MKQYVPNKPHPVGLKNFLAARPDGLVLDFVIYQGAKSFHQLPQELKLVLVVWLLHTWRSHFRLVREYTAIDISLQWH